MPPFSPLLESKSALHFLRRFHRPFGVIHGLLTVDEHIGRAGPFEYDGRSAARILHDLRRFRNRKAHASVDLLSAECDHLTVRSKSYRRGRIPVDIGGITPVDSRIADHLVGSLDLSVP